MNSTLNMNFVISVFDMDGISFIFSGVFLYTLILFITLILIPIFFPKTTRQCWVTNDWWAWHPYLWKKGVILYVQVSVLVLTYTLENRKNKWYSVSKIILTYCEKILFWGSRKTFEIRGWRPRVCKIFEITRTIYSNSERSEQFLVTECFFNLFLQVSKSQSLFPV